MREDFETANEVLPGIPKASRARVAHFLEKQGFKKQALAVTPDPEHQFDLALQVCYDCKSYMISKNICSILKYIIEIMFSAWRARKSERNSRGNRLC